MRKTEPWTSSSIGKTGEKVEKVVEPAGSQTAPVANGSSVTNPAAAN